MKTLIFYLLLGLILVPSVAQQMAVTFDDLPIVRQGESSPEEEVEIFSKILDVLDKYKIQAAGFVVGKKITEGYHRDLLKEWVSRGHVLGNHSFSHPDLNKTGNEEYKKDILKCQKVLKPYIQGVRYFRYPLLHRGDSEAKKEEIYRFLKQRNFRIASVSIDSDEYTFNLPARKAFREKNDEKLKEIKKEYLSHMKKRIKFYKKLSRVKIKRTMKHVLLLHSSFLNSLYLDDLLSMLRKDGWEFISLHEALKDPVYKLKDIYCGKKGLGWLERLNE